MLLGFQLAITTPEINQAGWFGHCSSLASLSLWLDVTRHNLLVCRNTFTSYCAKNYSDPKSGCDLDPDILGCTTSR